MKKKKSSAVFVQDNSEGNANANATAPPVDAIPSTEIPEDEQRGEKEKNPTDSREQPEQTDQQALHALQVIGTGER